MKRAELQNLIKKLGGPGVVGRACGISSQAVSKWITVPDKHCITLEFLARERRVVRSDGTPYTCEIFQPDINWGVIRSTPKEFIRVEA